KLLRIISDHSRAITFLISDGVFPSNEGRGYVLRRLIRKALRQGEILNIKLPFLYKIVPEIVRVMGSTYLDLKERKEHVIQVLKSEEDSYKRTIEEGSKVLDEIFQRQRRKNETVIAGEDLFKLYDTYGLPPEVVEEIAQDEGFTVDIKGFYLKMRSQKEKGRLAWVKGERKIIEAGEIYVHLANRFDSTKFVGYENLDYTSRILAIIKEGKEYHGRIKKGEEFEFITDATPFYAEMGGQVSDTGSFQMGEAKGNIINARYEKDGLIVHHARIDEGQTPVVEKIYLCVDKKRRQSIACHHTATHLLQYALRTMLGSHIQQSGSLVEESYLRFDFSHFSPIRKEELLKVEEMVNELIRKNLAVKTEYMKLGEAKKTGALSFFGEKYGEIVREVSIGQISRELCGGTHTQHTGEIGLFHILNESSIGKSLRRIEAVAAYPAYQRIRDKLHTLEKISFLLKTSPDAVDRRIQELIDEKKFLTREVDALREKFLVEKIKELPETAKSVEGIKVIGARLDGIDREVLRNLLDVLKNKMKSSSVILLGGVKDKKILLVGGLTTDLVKKGFHMGKIIKEVAKIA
ncbi:MAG TPA: alanine--tRNA ligase, partial [Candidatus Omnitrophica bacterium]|nr:alanine--tRNA ligase [Candidatus Omnitrophota bacterium]